MEVRGERVLKPTEIQKKHKVFVQSKGTGARHLDHNSFVLYKVYLRFTLQLLYNENFIIQVPSLVLSESKETPDDSLIPVPGERLQMNQLASDMTLQQFCDKYSLDLDKDEVFLEQNKLKGHHYFDVVLMRTTKVSCLHTQYQYFHFDPFNLQEGVQLFTGPGVHPIASKSSNLDETQRVFVACNFKPNKKLKQGTAILRSVNIMFDVCSHNNL